MVSFGVNKNTPEMRFVASLSDGTTVIQDSPKGQQHAWLRLISYVREKNLDVTGLRLVCGKEEIVLPSHQKGYYFSKRVMTIFPGNSSETHVGCGYYNESGINITWCLENDITKQKKELMLEAKGGSFLVKNKV